MNKLFAFWDVLTAPAKNTDEHIFIKTIRQAEEITLNNVILMILCADCSGDPQMLLIDETKNGTTTYHFPLCEGFQVHTCNEFLRSLDTGMDIKFVTYKQYGSLIEECFNAISK